MLGYLRKDFYLYRKQILMFGIGILLISSIAWIDPPMQNIGDDSKGVILVLDAIICIMIFLIIGMFEQCLYELDENCKWKMFVVAAPGCERAFIISKYVLTVFISVITGLWCNGIAVVASYRNDVTINLWWLILSLFSFQMIMRAIEIPIIFRFGSKYGSIYRMTVGFFLCFGVMVYLLFGDLSIWGSEEQILDTIVELISGNQYVMLRNFSIRMFVVAGLCYLISYFVSVRLYKKGV